MTEYIIQYGAIGEWGLQYYCENDEIHHNHKTYDIITAVNFKTKNVAERIRATLKELSTIIEIPHICEPGTILYGYTNGFFGRDNYDDKEVIEVSGNQIRAYAYGEECVATFNERLIDKMWVFIYQWRYLDQEEWAFELHRTDIDPKTKAKHFANRNASKDIFSNPDVISQLDESEQESDDDLISNRDEFLAYKVQHFAEQFNTLQKQLEVMQRLLNKGKVTPEEVAGDIEMVKQGMDMIQAILNKEE